MLHGDFETCGLLNLKDTGADLYARHPHTDWWCAAFAFDDEPVELIVRGQKLPQRVVDYIKAGGEFWAHNAPFELAIWNYVCVPRYGWPELRPEQTVCTMSQAYAMGLPGKLENAAAATGMPERKDMKGHRIMQQLAKPRSVTPDGEPVWWTPQEAPEKFEALYTYCKQDVEVERGLGKRILRLSPAEKRIWLLDYEINQRGVSIDVKSAQAASTIINKVKELQDEKMRALTDDDVFSCNAHSALLKWLQAKGVEVEGVTKSDVVEMLSKQHLPAGVREVLELRQNSAKSSTAKISKMLLGVDDTGRLRGMFQYHGAHTGRWAGRRVQLQNLPRPKLSQEEIEEVFSILETTKTQQIQGAIERINFFYGSPLNVLSDCLRGFIVAKDGCELVACDWSNIEGRKLAWLAGEKWKLQAFRDYDAGHGPDIYKLAYSKSFNVPVETISKQSVERQIGKTQELGLGFGGGVGALQTMARASNIQFAPSLPKLLEMASASAIDTANYLWEKKRDKKEISKDEYIASELVKIAWREAHLDTVSYWSQLEQAAKAAVNSPGKKAAARYVTFLHKGSFLWCRLPSGRVLCYPYPRIEEVKTAWGGKTESITYLTEDAETRRWERVSTYGGKLAENVTQASSACILREGMLAADARGWPIVLHAHDEIVIEVPKDSVSVEEMERVLAVPPKWASDLPIAVEGWRGRRYRK